MISSRKNYLALIILCIFFVSCSKDSEEPEAITSSKHKGLTKSHISAAIDNRSNKFTANWPKPDKAVKYHIQLSTDSLFRLQSLLANKLITTNRFESPLPDSHRTPVYMRMRTEYQSLETKNQVWSDWGDFEVTLPCAWGPPPTPVPIYPLVVHDIEARSNEEVGCFPEYYEWSESPIAFNYQLQLDNQPNFQSPELNIYTSDSKYAITSIDSLRGGSHYSWRVRARNLCGWSEWSTPLLIRRNHFPLYESPSITAPPDGSPSFILPITLDWEPTANANNYLLEVDDEATFASPEICVSITETEYLIEDIVPGEVHYWRVKAQNECGLGEFSPVWSFTPYCPPLMVATPHSPDNGSDHVAAPLQFVWYQIPGATKYQLQVSNHASFTRPIANREVTQPYVVLTALEEEEEFFWRVRSFNGCEWNEFNEPWSFNSCPTQRIPTPVAPSEAAYVSNPFNLIWDDDPVAVYYFIEIDSEPEFTDPIYSEETSSNIFNVAALRENVTYYWRVKTFNGCTWGDFCEPSSFLVCFPQNEIELLQPTDDAVTELAPTLYWTEQEGALYYEVQISLDPDMETPNRSINRQESHALLANLLENTQYFWWVRAFNGCEWGPYSEVEQFYTTYSRPVLISPDHSSVLSDPPYHFEWEYQAANPISAFLLTIQDPLPNSIQYRYTVQEGTAYTVYTELPRGHNYEWRVQAFTEGRYSNGQPQIISSDWSELGLFSTNCPLPGRVIPVMPLNNTPSTGQAIIFDWNDVYNTDSYRIQIAFDTRFHSIIADAERTESDYFQQNFEGDRFYYWRVSAINTCGQGPWSPTRTIRPRQ